MVRGRLIALTTRLIGPRLTARATRAIASTGAGGRQRARRIARRAPRSATLTMKYYGIPLELDLRDNVQWELYYMGDYETRLVSLVLAELEPTDTFVDIGAHIGVYSLPASKKLTAGKVFAFEPAPDTADRLESSAAKGSAGSLEVVRAAVGAEARTVVLRGSNEWAAEDLGVRSLQGDGLPVAEVPVVRFDDWARDVGLRRFDVVKVDVEGNEVSALTGMLGSLRQFRPRLLVIEVVPGHLERAGTSAQALAELLAHAGYDCEGPSVMDIAARPTGPFWPNAVLRPR